MNITAALIRLSAFRLESVKYFAFATSSHGSLAKASKEDV